MDVALDRDALYYPYIHITDVNWLKATLLSFPQVRRIVPNGFDLNDLEEVRPFLSETGARGDPLLGYEPAEHFSAYQAQERLLERLKEVDPEQLEQFTLAQTQTDGSRDPNAFQMHQGKLMPLLDFLRVRGLAWPARAISTSNPDEWFALHPRLGEVVMSLVAMAIAHERQLDIVTNSGRVHRALAQMDEASLVNSLFGVARPQISGRPSQGDGSDMAEELCQVVMLTAFDLSKLTAEKISALQKDGMDLRRFKNEILKIAKAIPDIQDPVERNKRLTEAALQVASEWARYRRSLPRFAIDALKSASSWKPPELLTSVLAGATSSVTLTAGAGLVIGLGVYAGLGVWREYKEQSSSPYQYLTRIQEAGASIAPKPMAISRPGDTNA